MNAESVSPALVEQFTELNEYFLEVAQQDPISAVLLAVGNLLIVVPVVVAVYLLAGAAVDLVTRS